MGWGKGSSVGSSAPCATTRGRGASGGRSSRASPGSASPFWSRHLATASTAVVARVATTAPAAVAVSVVPAVTVVVHVATLVAVPVTSAAEVLLLLLE